MNLKPLANRVLVEFLESDEKITKSGIVLPDTVEKKEHMKGRVVAVGPGKMTEAGTRVPVSVRVGDTVLFNKPWSDEKKIEEGAKQFFLVDEDDIVATIE